MNVEDYSRLLGTLITRRVSLVVADVDTPFGKALEISATTGDGTQRAIKRIVRPDASHEQNVLELEQLLFDLDRAIGS